MTLPLLSDIRACVFDAYGTLFDVASVARGAQDALGADWQALSDLWRSKQLQYKPHPSVYRLATDRLQLPKRSICFLSSNSWDAYSAKAFGYQVLWCNRFGQAPERIPATPDGEIKDLSGLPDLLIGATGR